MAKSHKFAGFARRLQNVGCKVSRSDRSETIYIRFGHVDLRISAHELGYADYGTRQQSHRGPEVVTKLTDLADVVAECIYECRDYAKCYAADWSAFERQNAAKTFCALRKLEKKING